MWTSWTLGTTQAQSAGACPTLAQCLQTRTALFRSLAGKRWKICFNISSGRTLLILDSNAMLFLLNLAQVTRRELGWAGSAWLKMEVALQYCSTGKRDTSVFPRAAAVPNWLSHNREGVGHWAGPPGMSHHVNPCWDLTWHHIMKGPLLNLPFWSSAFQMGLPCYTNSYEGWAMSRPGLAWWVRWSQAGTSHLVRLRTTLKNWSTLQISFFFFVKLGLGWYPKLLFKWGLKKQNA